MAEGVRVRNLESLKAFKIAMMKFASSSNVALGDAESEMQRTLGWLELDQVTHWQSQLRKLTEMLSKAKDAVRQKKLFKDSAGRPQSAVDEERQLAILQRKFEEAQTKLAATRSHSRKLTREIQLFKGSVQRFATSVQSEIPRATGRLENMVRTLEQYMNVEFEEAWKMSESSPSLARAGGGGGGSAADLRKLTPPGDVRDAAVQVDMDKEPWTIASLTPQDQNRLAKLSTLQTGGDNFGPDARVVFAKATSKSGRIYFEHVEPTGAGDTGWYIGPAGDLGIQAYLSVRVAELLSARPDLKHLLTLPKGSLLVVGEAGIESVYDQNGEDHWAAALSAEAFIAAQESAETPDPTGSDDAQAKPAP